MFQICCKYWIRSLQSDAGSKFPKIKTVAAKKDKRQNANFRSNSFQHSKNTVNETNNFIGNVGAARSMKAFGFQEHDDPSLSYIFGKGSFPDAARDPRDSIEDLFEETSAHKRELKIKKVNMVSKPKLREIMTKKRFYPDLPPPTLLTWAEKQTIRHLHDEEPGEWTAKKLSECFPAASEKIVKYELKNRYPLKMNHVQAMEHDDTVRRNWSLLTQGKLNDELGKDLYDHLMILGPSLVKGGNLSCLSSSNLKQLEETMLQAQQNGPEESFRISPGSAKGPFGSIISDYKNKLESKMALHEGIQSDKKEVNVIEGKHLLKDGDNPRRARDPRRGTSLINVDIDLKQEVPMTMKTFKKVFTKNLKAANVDPNLTSDDLRNTLTTSPVAEMSKQFLIWLQAEQKTDVKKVRYLDSDDGPRKEVKALRSHRPKLSQKSSSQISNSDSKSKDWSKSKWIQTISSNKY